MSRIAQSIAASFRWRRRGRAPPRHSAQIDVLVECELGCRRAGFIAQAVANIDLGSGGGVGPGAISASADPGTIGIIGETAGTIGATGGVISNPDRAS